MNQNVLLRDLNVLKNLNVLLMDLNVLLMKTATHLLAGAAAERLLDAGLLHLNVLVLIQTFLWVFLNFDLGLGRDPARKRTQKSVLTQPPS